MLYHGHRLIARTYILLVYVEHLFFCKMRLDFIIFFCWYLKKKFLVYPEVLGWAMGEVGFEQLASIINFLDCGGKSIEEYRIFVARGCFIKKLLMANTRGRDTLFLRKLLAYNSFFPVKIKTFSSYTRTRRCVLYQLFDVKMRWYHRVYGVNTMLLFKSFLSHSKSSLTLG